jgi:TetR/AcrR family transcriptional regulator, regulator of cefoperazone and chloramphenicol sensitivity
MAETTAERQNRAVTSRHDPRPGQPARDRILIAAMACFAQDGFAAASIRRIARRADVSPGLVQYHFGSKDALRAAVDDHVMHVIQRGLGETRFELPLTDVKQAITSAFVDHALSRPEIYEYLRRAMFEDDAAAAELQAGVIRLAEATLRKMAASGLLRPDTDITWASIQITLLVNGPHLMRAAVERYLGQPLSTREVLIAMHRANEALAEHGIMRHRRPAGDDPAPDSRVRQDP